MHNFELQFWHVGGCAGYPLSSKSILKVKKQMSLPKQHVHIPFLTPWIAFVGILGFRSMALRCKTPCKIFRIMATLKCAQKWILLTLKSSSDSAVESFLSKKSSSCSSWFLIASATFSSLILFCSSSLIT